MNSKNNNKAKSFSELPYGWQLVIKIGSAVLLLALIAVFVWSVDWLIAYIKELLF